MANSSSQQSNGHGSQPNTFLQTFSPPTMSTLGFGQSYYSLPPPSAVPVSGVGMMNMMPTQPPQEIWLKVLERLDTMDKKLT